MYYKKAEFGVTLGWLEGDFGVTLGWLRDFMVRKNMMYKLLFQRDISW